MATGFSFIHASDLHLDSPFKGLSNYNEELGKICKQSTFKAYSKIISIAIEKKVDFVLFAGDIFESETRSLIAQKEFFKGLEKLNNNGIRVYITHGNHDPSDQWLSTFKTPDLTTVFGCNNIESHTVYSKHGDQIAVIHGISFKNSQVSNNLVQQFPQKENNYFNIGLIHCSAGSNNEHCTYAPCSLEDIKSKNYDYWALGHIHKPTVLNNNYPNVIYSGTSQGRNFKESGSHGCFYVQVEDKIVNHSHISADYVRWNEITVNISEIESREEFICEVKNSLESVNTSDDNLKAILIKVNITGRSELHKLLSKNYDELPAYLDNFQVLFVLDQI